MTKKISIDNNGLMSELQKLIIKLKLRKKPELRERLKLIRPG